MFSPCANAADGAVGVDQRIDPCERLGEVAQDQRAHLLRPQVVGVVIAGRQHIGADQDAPPHLGAEARRAGALVQVAQVRRRSRAGRSARRHSAPGWTKPPPAPRCSRSSGRTSCAAARRRRSPRRRRAASPGPAATGARSPPACRPCGIRAARRCAGPSRRAGRPPRSPAPAHRRWWNPSDRARPSSRAGSRSPAPCARTARDDRATTRTPPRPSASSGHRSASCRRCRRTTPAGGSSRRYRCRSRPSPAAPPPPPPNRRTSRPAPAPRVRSCRRCHGLATGP